jgi:hypothetical protein
MTYVMGSPLYPSAFMVVNRLSSARLDWKNYWGSLATRWKLPELKVVSASRPTESS